MTHCEMALYLLCGAVAIISIYVAIMLFLIEEGKKNNSKKRTKR